MPDELEGARDEADRQATPPVEDKKEQYVTREELATTVREVVAPIRDAIETLRPAPAIQAAPQEERLPELSDEDEPDVRTAKIVERGLAPIKKQLRDLEAIGLGTMGSIAREVAIPKMKYYTRFQKEIDGYVSGLPPALRARPDALEQAHRFVVSQHLDELINEGAESRAREIVKTSTPNTPVQRGRLEIAEGVPTPEDLGFSEAQEVEIDRRGGPDAFARKLGHASWKEYAENQTKFRTRGKLAK